MCGTYRLPTLDEFKRFLDTKAKGRREFEHETDWSKQGSSDNRSKNDSNTSRFKPYPKDGNRDRSFNNRERTYPRNETGGNPQSRACVVPNCRLYHPVWKCEMFAKLPLTERKELTHRHKLCRCCLSPGHMSAECSRGSCMKCPESKWKHHFRLCPKTTADGAGSNQFAKRAIEAPKQ